jgi:hypothetical protein
VIGVGTDAAGKGVCVRSGELRVAAVFTSDISTEPVVELVTGAETEDAGRVEAEILDGRREAEVVGVVQAIDTLIAEADVAAQIPAAEILDRRRVNHRRRRDRHVGGKCHRRHQGRRSGGNERLNATHWLRPFGR